MYGKICDDEFCNMGHVLFADIICQLGSHTVFVFIRQQLKQLRYSEVLKVIYFAGQPKEDPNSFSFYGFAILMKERFTIAKLIWTAQD